MADERNACVIGILPKIIEESYKRKEEGQGIRAR
jgi:hypothetical protein